MNTVKKESLGYVIFLSIVAAIGGILYGFDTAVISGTVSKVSQQFSLDTLGEGWYVGCALIGSIFGVAIAGIISDKFGRKPTMILSAILFSASAIGCAICSSFTQLVVYRIIGGVGIGIVSIVSPMYISEIAISKYRGTLVELYQLSITIGFLLAFLFNFQIAKLAERVIYESQFLNMIFKNEIWRGMLGSETIIALLFLILIFFIPESPRWIAIKTSGDFSKGNNKGELKALFEPGMRKALIIGMSIAILGQFMGVNAVLYYGPEIFAQSGLSSSDSLYSQVLVGVVNMVTTVIALIIIDKVGRKKLIYWGVSGMILSLILIGIYFSFGDTLNLSTTFLLIFFLFYVFCCAISICAVVWVLLSEMYPTRVRGVAMSIAGFALWIGTYLVGQLTPWLLENLTPGGTFFLFAAMCIPYMCIMYKCVPETTGKSLEEIEKYWSNN